MAEPQISHESSAGSRDSDRLQLLYAVNAMLRQVEAGGLDIDVMLPRVLSIAVEEIRGRTGSIIIANERQEVEHFWHIDDSGQTQPREFLAEILTDGIAGKVIHSRAPILISDTTSDPRWLPRPGHPTALAPWSALCVPLQSRSAAFGAITITKPGAGQFAEDDLNLLETIANQAATSLENARLFADSRQRAQAFSDLVAATQAVSSSLLQAEVARLVPQQMARLLHVSACILVRWDPMTERFAPWSAHPSLSQLGPVWKEAPWSRETMASKQPVQKHLRQSPANSADEQWLRRHNAMHVLTVPMVAQGKVVALIHLLGDTPLRTISPNEVAMVQTLANQAVVAMANAQLYERTQRQLRETAFLNDAGAVVNSTLDIDEIMQALLAKTNEILNVEALSVALLDDQANELEYRIAVGAGSREIAGLRLPANEGVAGWVLQHGEPALVPDATKDGRVSPAGDARTNHKTKAIICAPLQVKGEILGTIQAINPYIGTFTEEDLQLLVRLANLAGTALDNARQFARTQAAEARYMGLFEDSIDPIILTSPSGRILETNRRATEFLGYTKEELLKLTVDMLHPDDPDLFNWRQLAAMADQVQVLRSHVVTRDLSRIPVEVHAKRLANDQTEIIQWIHKDITDQVELEAMREDLMAMLFHDLQSPLSNVISGLELLEYELDPVADDKAMTILSIARRSSQRLGHLIRSLLDISRLEAGHTITNKKPTTVERMVDMAMEVVEPSMARRNIAFLRDVTADLPTVVVDQDMITRVLINLLDNALKYSDGGQNINVSAHAVPATNSIRLAVADEGPGIPESQRSAIFDKFYRLHGEGTAKGLGLGLAFCRMAVEGHGGRIWVEEAPGGGAMFAFTLPAKAQEAHD